VRDLIDELGRIAGIPLRGALASGPDHAIAWRGATGSALPMPATVPLATLSDAGLRTGDANVHAPPSAPSNASNRAAIAHSAAPGTLTSASVGGIGDSHPKKRSRPLLPIAISATVLLFGVGIAATALRMRGGDEDRSVVAVPTATPTQATEPPGATPSDKEPVPSKASAPAETRPASAQPTAAEMPSSVQRSPMPPGAVPVVTAAASSAMPGPAAATPLPRASGAKRSAPNRLEAPKQPKPRPSASGDIWFGN
jgi:hypothetical protein